jgi:ketosteroid isomerase-like protein
MTATETRELAARPEDLSDLFLTRANAGDVEGIVALYEPGAILALPGGGSVSGHQEIRKFYTAVLACRPSFKSRGQRAVLRNGDLALTSTRLPSGDTTVEVARRQQDGSWLWTIDQPALLSS